MSKLEKRSTWVALALALLVAFPVLAQRQLNIQREEERVAKQRERERIDNLLDQELEQQGLAVVVFSSDGSVTIFDQRQPAAEQVEVLAVKLGKAEAEIAGEASRNERFRVRTGKREGAKPSKKLRLEIASSAEKKPDKLICNLERDTPAESADVRVYILRGELIDFHCRDL